MSLNENWKSELLSIFPSAVFMHEGGYNFAYIPEVVLPPGCTPDKSPVLLCISPRDGYDSRLYFPNQMSGSAVRNWNSTVYILDTTWHAISWATKPGLSYLEMLMVHLTAFK